MTEDLESVPFETPEELAARTAAKPPAKVNGDHDESFDSATPVKISKEVVNHGAEGSRSPKGPTERRAESITPAPRAARVLPHSLEAESGLLGSCFVDGETVVPMADEQGITGSSFYDHSNGLIFSVLLSLSLRKIPITTSIVYEELKDDPNWKGGNLFTKLTEVTESTATTAQANYFIERVRSLALQREIIRQATSVVEIAYEPQPDIQDLVDQVRKRLDLSGQAGVIDSALRRLELSRYDPGRRLPDVAPVFHLGKVAICTRGNLTTITAVTKVGKSSFVAGVLASTFKDPDHGGDTFTVRGLNTESHAVIHFDTEQHGKHHERMMDAVCRRAGAELPAWLCSYSRKGASASQLRQELEAVLKSKHKLHGGIHSVHLDGIADFAADVNDAKECNPLVSWLEGLSVAYNCPILCVLHLNPVSARDVVQKSRGHLGSQLQRKVETDIRLKKEDDDTTVVFTDPQGTRGAPIFEKDGPRFKWDADEQMHMTCRGSGGPKDQALIFRLREVASDALAHAKATRLRYGDFIRAIEQSAEVSAKRAEARLADMKKYEVLAKDMFGFWQLSEPSK